MKQRVQSLFDPKRRLRILVVGDLILDEYIWGSVQRISPEAPVPILESKAEDLTLGGAANVANNLVALGCEVHLVGGLGQDEKGDRLLEGIRRRGIHTEGIRRFVHRPTTSKIRVIANNQQMLRIDKEDNRPITEENEKKFIQYINRTLPKMDGVICSDYQKGILTEKVVNTILQRATNSKRLVVVDPKGTDYTKYAGATVITPNQTEVERVAPIKIATTEDLERAAEYLINLTKAEAILITRGKEGMVLYRKNEAPLTISTTAREVYDVTGAGDTAVSVLGVGLFGGLPMEEAASLANHAAGIVVGKIGTAVVTREEIQLFLEEEMYRTMPPVLTLEEVKRFVSLAKSCGKTIVFTNGCFDVVHPGHVRYLS
ncbi:MAG: D-glycero-beta-D-manno-heptose-7-phosphate kinase, partial [Nitrospinaceae bacterium]